MKFKMNGRTWTIKEVDQKWFWEDDGKLDEMNNREHFFGRTCFSEQMICLDKDISAEQKRKTLYHELLHCYIGMYIGFSGIGEQNEEFVCDLTANAHDIINEIVEKYFNRGKTMAELAAEYEIKNKSLQSKK